MMITKAQARRHDIDWLRIFAMLAVFFFHCAGIFSLPYFLENQEKSMALSFIAGFCDAWAPFYGVGSH